MYHIVEILEKTIVHVGAGDTNVAQGHDLYLAHLGRRDVRAIPGGLQSGAQSQVHKILTVRIQIGGQVVEWIVRHAQVVKAEIGEKRRNPALRRPIGHYDVRPGLRPLGYVASGTEGAFPLLQHAVVVVVTHKELHSLPLLIG